MEGFIARPEFLHFKVTSCAPYHVQDQAQRAFDAEDRNQRGAGLTWPLFMRFMRRNVSNISGEHRRSVVSYLHAQVQHATQNILSTITW